MKRPPILRVFRDFINEKLKKNRNTDLSPEEALDEFRLDHNPLDDEDDVAAIQAAIDDLEAGEKGMPLGKFDRELRKEFPFLDRPQ